MLQNHIPAIICHLCFLAPSSTWRLLVAFVTLSRDMWTCHIDRHLPCVGSRNWRHSLTVTSMSYHTIGGTNSPFLSLLSNTRSLSLATLYFSGDWHLTLCSVVNALEYVFSSVCVFTLRGSLYLGWKLLTFKEWPGSWHHKGFTLPPSFHIPAGTHHCLPL